MDRLETIVELSKGFSSIADIGCDHGQVGVNLVKDYGFKSIINTDISDKCLKKAEELFKLAGIGDFYDGRVGDGLKPIEKSEVDCIIIAGMGGDLIVDIISEDESKTLSFKNYIIQPMTNPDKVRKKFSEIGYGIKKDICVIEDNKYYFIIEFSKDEPIIALDDYYYTKTLIRDSKDSFKLFLQHQLDKNFNIIKSIQTDGSEKSLEKIDCLNEENIYLEGILNESLSAD